MKKICRKILYFALPIIFVGGCLTSNRTINQHFIPETDLKNSGWPSWKFACGRVGQNYAFGVSVQTRNQVDICGYSTSEGIKIFSYRIDENRRNIADSGFGF